MNYRKFYEEQICDVPNEFQVHHIDGDKENNDISNLLMLPQELHAEYHRLKNVVESQKLELKIKGSLENGNRYNFWLINEMDEFVKVYAECGKWADYKSYKLGLLPNINNIGVK